ncbi:D-alanyl-D-alanine carboxypeptidase family protein [Bacillus horti]|nr:D-alanyl-D-alanine carboxypeptidase family protein [Bacillus horti]
MKKIGWLGLIVMLAFTTITGGLGTLSVAANTPFDLDAESALLVEVETGKIVFSKNADVALPPASMSKMMTEYLVLEAIHNGDFDWDTVVTTSPFAHFIASLDGTSRVWLAQGEQRTVEELYTAMAVYSGNDATVALAEQVAGSEQLFVQLMNEKARELGMTNSHFVNSTGLPNSMLGQHIHTGTESDENLMSARDTAILARALVREYPEVLEFSSIPEIEAGYFDIEMINFNWMLEGHRTGTPLGLTYQGLDGLKTGYTDLAGNCFTGTAERDGVRLISVIMKSETQQSRFVETQKLLDYGFNNFELNEVVQAGEIIEGYETIPVAKGKQKELPVAIEQALTTYMYEGEEELYTLEVVMDPELVDEEGRLIAPIEQGTAVGEVRVVYTGNTEYSFIQQDQTSESLELIAQEDIEKAGWLRLFMRSILEFFSNVWVSIVEGIQGWFS